MHVHLYVLLLLILVVSIQSQTCTCICGTSSFSSGRTCSTSSGCSSTCYNYYSACGYYTTRGCCGTQSCVYYSSTYSYPSYYYSYNQCNCKCSTAINTSPSLMGSPKMSGCNDTNCQEACNSLYPTSCGVYTNQAYCTNGTGRYQSKTSVFILGLIIVYLFQNKNKYI